MQWLEWGLQYSTYSTNKTGNRYKKVASQSVDHDHSESSASFFLPEENPCCWRKPIWLPSRCLGGQGGGEVTSDGCDGGIMVAVLVFLVESSRENPGERSTRDSRPQSGYRTISTSFSSISLRHAYANPRAVEWVSQSSVIQFGDVIIMCNVRDGRQAGGQFYASLVRDLKSRAGGVNSAFENKRTNVFYSLELQQTNQSRAARSSVGRRVRTSRHRPKRQLNLADTHMQPRCNYVSRTINKAQQRNSIKKPSHAIFNF